MEEILGNGPKFSQKYLKEEEYSENIGQAAPRTLYVHSHSTIETDRNGGNPWKMAARTPFWPRPAVLRPAWRKDLMVSSQAESAVGKIRAGSFQRGAAENSSFRGSRRLGELRLAPPGFSSISIDYRNR